MNNKTVEVEVVSAEKAASAEFKAINMTGKFPFLTTPEGNLSESIAIAKYLAHGHPTLMGSTPEENAKVNQWMYWAVTTLLPDQLNAVKAIHGFAEVSQADYTVSQNAIKANAKTLNVALAGKDWIVGNSCTLADITLACFQIMAQQTILDGGFRKAMP